jgi:hypothetical protein
MALDPSIALGVKPLEIANPLAQYGQIAQLQAAQNQNALAQYQLSAAQRQDAAQNALGAAYQKGINPETGALDQSAILSELAKSGAGHLIPEVQAKLLKAQQEQAGLKKTQVETSGLEFDQRVKKANKAISDIAALNSPEEAAASIDQHLANGDIDASKAAMLKSQLAQAPSFTDWQKGMLTNILDAKDRLTATAPKPTQVRLGDSVKTIDMNPNSPTYKQEVIPAQKIGMSEFEKAHLPILQQNANAATSNAATNRAGLSLRAIQADPYNINGVQAAFPIPGAPVGGAPSPDQKQPSGAPVIQNVQAAMKAGLTGEDLLTHLPTGLANQVRAIGEGREPSPSSRSLTTPGGRQLMDLVMTAYPTYDAKQYATMGTAEKAFTSGKKGDITRSFNAAVDHLGTLEQAANALQNNDMRLFNQAGNYVALQTGQTAPTDFNAVKRIVADEITKAVLGGSGALGDRKAADEAISAANSPEQLKGVIARYKNLMGGQLNALDQQYKASTNKTDFKDRFLTPTTKAALTTAAPAATTGGEKVVDFGSLK